ncbi:MAG: hypothetical protein H6737_11430 [Alphaproteobacteria bacterium]|nr:hypothetical protein [Alphaproteobacteria bacterium]
MDRPLWRRIWEAVGPEDPLERAAWLRGDEAEDGDDDGEDGAPEPTPDPRFRPWDLQDEATLVEGDARRAVLDAAIAAFDAIADAPIDPGNDEGPFWAVARLFDLDQVHRAFDVLDRMAPHPWTYRLGGSRSALIGRLADLGQLAEAEARMADFDASDPFATHWRAVACGRWVAAALGTAPLPALLERVGFASFASDAQFQLLCALWDVPVPGAPLARDALAAARSVPDPRIRSLVVRYFAEAWWAALPPEEWIGAVQAEQDAALALLDLADTGGPVALRAAEALLRVRPDAAAFAELLECDADPAVLEACAEAWLATGPSRWALDRDALRPWLVRAGALEGP